MARRKRKDEPTDWVAPDFDEVGYMRTEIQAAKTAVLTIAWAAVGAIVSFLLYSVNAALAFFAGIGVAFGLYYVLPYLGSAVKGFKRRDWTGHGITYFFSWLAFWILLLNPPFGDFTTPTIQAISVSPVHTGYTGYLSCLPLVGGAVTVPLTMGNDSVYVLFRATDNVGLASLQVNVTPGGSSPRSRSRHFPLTSDSAEVASRVTSTAQRSPWRYGPANVFGLRRHLSRRSFEFLTQTGGPSCLEALGRDANSSSKRNKASLPTRSNRESNTWKADRWSRSANDRWAFRNCG